MDTIFQPTLPLRGATSILALTDGSYTFQPTLPLRGATGMFACCPLSIRFQPTLPLRGATSLLMVSFWKSPDFNPRSPCGERLHRISIPRACPAFQPTLPLRGATWTPPLLRGFLAISTHAPPAGSDPDHAEQERPVRDFNPRSPCGERLRADDHPVVIAEFQPTLPLRGATYSVVSGAKRNLFQPTLPLRGATLTSPFSIAAR